MTGAVESAALKAGAGLAKPVGWWLWRRFRPDISRAALVGYADNLADAVRRRETVLREQLRGGPGTAMELELRVATQEGASSTGAGALSDLVRDYQDDGPPRRMVILGAAGAGKTVSAIQLILDQVRARADLPDAVRAHTPVPVRVNAAGWDGSNSFTRWLAGRLSADFGLRSRVARELADSGRILPVLDGLDEMDLPGVEPRRACAMLDRLNETPWRNRDIVIVCRTGVYRRVLEIRGDGGLHGAMTITVQPLTVTDVYCYLDDYRAQLGIGKQVWTPVTEQLTTDSGGPLGTALDTPWLLGLAATALHRGSSDFPARLAACPDTTAVHELLFATFIPAAIAGTDRAHRVGSYTERNVHTWLHALALHLDRQRSRDRAGTDFTLDKVWRLAGIRRCRILYALTVAFVIGLMEGATAAVTAGVAGLVFVPVFVVLAALAYWALLGFWLGGEGPSSSLWFIWRVRGRSRWRRAVTAGVVAGLVPALVIALVIMFIDAVLIMAGQETGPKKALTIVISFAILFGPPFGLGTGLGFAVTDPDTPQRFAWRVPGRSRWRRALVIGLVVAAAVTLVVALVLNAIVVIAGERGAMGRAVAIALGVGLTFGLGVGLLAGLGTTSEERLVLGQDERRVICDDLVGALVFVVVVVVLVGLTMGLVDVRLASLLGVFLAGLLLGLLFEHTSGRYAIASLLFRLTGSFPPRPASFLEWARNAGLLRVTGIAYQFRHDTYQHWLVHNDPHTTGTHTEQKIR